MSLLLRHPKIAFRNCQSCRDTVYDEKTGRQTMFHGQPILRGKVGPPCTQSDGKCPKGHYSNPIELSPRNRKAYLHYLECKAVGSFPSDEIVRRNAMLIRSIEDAIAEQRKDDFEMAVLTIGARRV